MRDFTTRIYRKLLIELIRSGYTFQTFQEYLIKPAKRVVILRHDVHTRKKNSLLFAHIEHALHLPSSYYFRIIPKSFDPVILSLIRNLNHEIGYQYEDHSLARGDQKQAIILFENHLSELRKHFPVKTICMHSGQLSKYDNRELWKHYKYNNYGIIGDPYFDIDFDSVLYITDTGRRWRNKTIGFKEQANSPLNLKFRSTRDLIRKVPHFPDKVMIAIHPERWTDTFLPWLFDLIFQNIKNIFYQFYLCLNPRK